MVDEKNEFKTWASSEELKEIYSTTKEGDSEQLPKLIAERNFCYNCQTDWDLEEIKYSLDGSEHCPDCGEDLAVPPTTNPWEIWP